MSDENNNNEVDTTSCCAACGIAEVDDIKLKDCDGCDLVKYCSDECRELHRSEHEEACKQRADELREELLFKQPESSHYGDCPICCVPLPLDPQKSRMADCCSKVICDGCALANAKREVEMRLQPSCPFCRQQFPRTEEECIKRNIKRIEANDPVALCHEGHLQREKGEYQMAFEYWTKAAELGDAEAHYHLSVAYRLGHGVEKDEGKEIYHLEEAAIDGHPNARYNLGFIEWNSRNNVERAVKHWIIAATQGDNDSIKWLMKAFKDGLMEKEDLAAALRARKAAVDATKSPQRDIAEKYCR